ncbi:MAG: mechanosensitive ion channel family protein, partial [Nanoarchaeota archaeon]|nr:mechanosensitive ion channel family protein [Nanoarchaeota archaeon]
MIDIINQIKGIKIIYIIVLLILFYVGSKVLYWIIEKVIKAFVRKTKTQLDDLILEKTDKPVVWLFFFIALRVFILPLINFKILGEINDSIIILLISLVIIAAVDVLIDFWGKKWAKKTKSRLDDDLLPLFHKFSKITIFIIAFIMILDVWSINITPFLASLGVAGIILAFALQSTLGNIFGGISLILDK